MKPTYINFQHFEAKGGLEWHGRHNRLVIVVEDGRVVVFVLHMHHHQRLIEGQMIVVHFGGGQVLVDGGVHVSSHPSMYHILGLDLQMIDILLLAVQVLVEHQSSIFWLDLERASIVGADNSIERRLASNLIGGVEIDQQSRRQLVLLHRHLVQSLREQAHTLSRAHDNVDLGTVRLRWLVVVLGLHQQTIMITEVAVQRFHQLHLARALVHRECVDLIGICPNQQHDYNVACELCTTNTYLRANT